ncbi:MAG: hypothetical protein LUD27_08370 [Clostridia bacterium]|nr:hypothetical protein [Clostridia bacterium]
MRNEAAEAYCHTSSIIKEPYAFPVILREGDPLPVILREDDSLPVILRERSESKDPLDGMKAVGRRFFDYIPLRSIPLRMTVGKAPLSGSLNRRIRLSIIWF